MNKLIGEAKLKCLGMSPTTFNNRTMSHTYIYIHTHTHKSTSTGNRMFQRLQKLVPLKHLSSEHMIYAHRN